MMGHGDPFLTSSPLAGRYLGLVLSCQTILEGRNVKEESKGGKTVSNALKTLNIRNTSYSTFESKKNI